MDKGTVGGRGMLGTALAVSADAFAAGVWVPDSTNGEL